MNTKAASQLCHSARFLPHTLPPSPACLSPALRPTNSPSQAPVPAPARPAPTPAAHATEGEAPFRQEFEPRHAKASTPGATGVSSGSGGGAAGTGFGAEEAAPASFHAYEPRIATEVANRAEDKAAELAESARWVMWGQGAAVGCWACRFMFWALCGRPGRVACKLPSHCRRPPPAIHLQGKGIRAGGPCRRRRRRDCRVGAPRRQGGRSG